MKRVLALDNASTRIGGLSTYGGRYFYFKVTPQDQTPKLYARDGAKGEERLLADPQVIGGDAKKRFTITDFYPSPDGTLVGVEVAAGGSEEGVLRIIDAATGKLLPDAIDRVWGSSPSWDPSDKFFYYTRLQKLGPKNTPLDKELDETSYLHHLGDNPDKDVAVLGRKVAPALGMVPTDSAYVSVTPGSPYVLGLVSHGVRNELTLAISPADAAAKGAPVWTKFVDVDDDVTSGAIMGHDMWLLTHKDASKFKVIHIDLDHPDIAKADVTVPPSDLVIQGVSTSKDALYVEAAQGGISHLLRIPYGQTTATPVKLPFDGSIEGFFSDIQFNGVLIRFAGWTEAPQWYQYDPATDTLTNTNIEALNPTDFSGITSVEATATGADGTPVPLSIIYKKDLPLNGQNPCLMEGYGAYGISLDPNFDATRLALLEKGIVIAYAHVRGGGENGEDWHIAGQKLTKQNTISDFIACAEYLDQARATRRPVDAGGSRHECGWHHDFGGALTQRPDLFGLAICQRRRDAIRCGWKRGRTAR